MDTTNGDAEQGPVGNAPPSGQEAPSHPTQDPTKKTDATDDPKADDPGNGAD